MRTAVWDLDRRRLCNSASSVEKKLEPQRYHRCHPPVPLRPDT